MQYALIKMLLALLLSISCANVDTDVLSPVEFALSFAGFPEIKFFKIFSMMQMGSGPKLPVSRQFFADLLYRGNT